MDSQHRQTYFNQSVVRKNILNINEVLFYTQKIWKQKVLLPWLLVSIQNNNIYTSLLGL